MFDKQSKYYTNLNVQNEQNLSDELVEPSPDINKNIIPHIKNDYILSHINKNLEKLDFINDKNELYDNKRSEEDFHNVLDQNDESNDAVNNNSVIFTNSFIQTSLIRANILRKIFYKNSEKIQKYYLRKWKNSNFRTLFNQSSKKISNCVSTILQDDLNKISDEILKSNNNNTISNKKDFQYNSYENSKDHLNRNRKVIENCLLDEFDDSNKYINEKKSRTEEGNVIFKNEVMNSFVENQNELNTSYTTKLINQNDNNQSYSFNTKREFNENSYERGLSQNDFQNLKDQNSYNQYSEFNNSHNAKLNVQNQNSYSMKNISLDKHSILYMNDNNDSSNDNNRFSRTSTLKLNKSVDVGSNKNINNNHEIISTPKNKMQNFIEKLRKFIILKEKSCFLNLFLILYKKAFKEAGEKNCINFFRLFTNFSICKTKLKNLQSQNKKDFISNNDEILQKQIIQLKSEKENFIKSNENFSNMIAHLKNECLKLEQNLKEKATIIFNKNDEIEANREQIDILTQKNDSYKEQIDLLNKKIDKLESKLNNTKLNIIEESLCKNCKNSLEESFMHENSTPKNKNEIDFNINFDKNQESEKFRLREHELKKTIQEQLSYIIKMEEDMRDLRMKNNDYKSKNEIILNELDIIKMEFYNLSENLKNKNLKPKSEISVQTEDQNDYPYFQTDNNCNINNNNLNYNKLNIDKNFNYTNGNNLNPMNNKTENFNENKENEKDKQKSVSKTITGKTINKKAKQFSNKLVLRDSKDKTSNINTNSATNTNINININNNFKTELDLLISEREQLQNLKFDNSVLTKEIVGLNKELNKIKAENKSLTENFKKADKEKSELLTKLKGKSEAFEKIKKENEELMIMIQSSNYKTFVSIETENKKLKSENIQILKDIESLKIEFTIKEKVLKDKENEIEKLKKNFENFNKFKNDRENLILENTKLESELKRTRFDIEEIKNVIEKQNILLRNKDECLNKLSEEFNYLNFNAKKLKQESDKNLQDAIAYQQIVRKMEKELAECQIKKEKYENELMIIKANLMK